MPDERPSTAPTTDPEAARLFDRLKQAFAGATSVCLQSALQWWSSGRDMGAYTYRLWMRKRPYGVRVETCRDGKLLGVLVGTAGEVLIHWPGGRPLHAGDDPAEHERTRYTSYFRKQGGEAGPAHLKYWFGMAGTEVCSVLQPMFYLGTGDTITSLAEGMRCLGAEPVDGEECDILDISAIGGLRHRALWLARSDGLPRKLEETITAAYEMVKHERWQRLALNEDLADELFQWQPPQGWTEWSPPGGEMLKPGAQAPDFTRTAIDGSEVTLSAYRGKVVWLVFWRMTCPPCREEIPYLEGWHRRCAGAGLSVIGFNYGDGIDTARAFLDQRGVSFASIVDSSDDGWNLMTAYGVGGVPANYIIDREGRIAGAWAGFHGYSGGPHGDEGPPEKTILAKLGIVRAEG